MTMDFSGARVIHTDSRYSFAEVAAKLLGNAQAVCRYLLPGGAVANNEYIAADIRGGKGKSMSINLRTGVWKDFAGIEGGADLIALWAAAMRVSQGEAKDVAEQWFGLGDGGGAAAPVGAGRKLTGADGSSPAPQSPADTDENWWKTVKPSMKWEYHNASGDLFGTVYRFDLQGYQKVIRPWDGARWQVPEGIRPLYRLPQILAHNGPVVVVEGEKSADAVVAVDRCGTTCWGGSQAIAKTDWAPLKGRDVVLWPDNDPAGKWWLEAVLPVMKEVGALSVRVVE
jgi:putative DNA primase/helicase